jgi:hypothetical protein
LMLKIHNYKPYSHSMMYFSKSKKAYNKSGKNIHIFHGFIFINNFDVKDT